jgi:hypothetical protein
MRESCISSYAKHSSIDLVVFDSTGVISPTPQLTLAIAKGEEKQVYMNGKP